MVGDRFGGEATDQIKATQRRSAKLPNQLRVDRFETNVRRQPARRHGCHATKNVSDTRTIAAVERRRYLADAFFDEATYGLQHFPRTARIEQLEQYFPVRPERRIAGHQFTLAAGENFAITHGGEYIVAAP
ncbi:hypothetical protein [Mycobacterium sp.]|uniref:hypothetical protein n=1 Tax=Mycobacterium sp. TaxID=1785 RepID=UPI0028BDEF0F|nr:hypothetical protein [Mycobacterium sp.]